MVLPMHASQPTPSIAAPALQATWPYPFWIAHRGAGKLAPENTLAAFRTGAEYGYRMFECDVKLSADGVPFLLHDDTLERTTQAASAWGTGYDPVAGHHPWEALSLLDAGGWHSRRYAGEPLATLEAVAQFCIRNGYALNLEIKPSPGTAQHTGEIVAQHVARLWQGQALVPLLSSFEVEALQGAQATQAELPRALLLDTLWDGWLATAMQLQCIAVVCNHRLWDTPTVAQVHQAGMRCLSYTVNDASDVQRMMALGTDGIITDKVDVWSPV